MLGFDIRWYDTNKTILIWEFPRAYSIAQLAAAGSTVPPMLDNSPNQRIDIAMLMNHADEISGTGNIAFLTQAFANLHPKVGKCVFIAPSLFTELTLQCLRADDIPGADSILFADTLQEAVQMIRHYRGERNMQARISGD